VSGAKGTEGGRLGGARADFVASLGRKVNDARELLMALEDDPTSKSGRDELRRRIHALAAGARLLRFDAMARALQETLGVLDRGARAGAFREQDVSLVAQTLDDLPALAWSESPPRERSPESTDSPDEASAQAPQCVLVVGGEDLADTLTDDSALRSRAFECERTEDVHTALELARAYAPDALVIDADVPQAASLVETLVEDPLTEPVPILVVGTFHATDEVARFVALGVARALPKPVSAEVLRRACDDVLEAREGRTIRVTLGEPTLEQLATRLGDELKRALLESVDAAARSCRIPLGEGTEVLGALWGAIARVQEVVATRTRGAIRFGGDAPEGAIALAPWLHHDLAAAERTTGRGRSSGSDVRLDGRRVVVADDDPGVTWFISDLLRTAGCEVHEALDGAAALDLAFRVQPELVVSDILMPQMDGFALCRALRRDVALRDTPVILLSWKEDLLQRVRELGASAAAYMRKETDSRAILARVREVLRPRARVEMRLRSEGEVRGRLDGLTPRLLLELVCSIRKQARVAVRDATYFYEVEIRSGAPRKATRTASDGSYQRGDVAVAGLLGVGAGRFVVTPTTEPVRGDLNGSLAEQLAGPIAAARGALTATTGARTMHVDRLKLDERILQEYLAATPNPTNTLIQQLARGISPRHILLAGEVAPSLLEDVLADLAVRGAIRSVEGPGGVDLLGPAVEAALAALKGAPTPVRSVPPNTRQSAFPAPMLIPRSSPSRPGRPADAPAAPVARKVPSPAPAPPRDAEQEAVPSSLEDAVMRELSDRSPALPSARPSGSDPPPIVEPSDLRPRSSNPPGSDQAQGAEEEDPDSIQPSIPPDAIVPGSSDEVLAAPPVQEPDPHPVPARVEDRPIEEDAMPPAMPPPVPLPVPLPIPLPMPPPIPQTAPLLLARAMPAPALPEARPLREPVHPEPAPDKQSYLSLALWTVAFGLLGIAIGLAWRGSLAAAIGSAWHAGAVKQPATLLGDASAARQPPPSAPASASPAPSASSMFRPRSGEAGDVPSPAPPVASAPATETAPPP
jgi:DNA-binding response OmpR family regulator